MRKALDALKKVRDDYKGVVVFLVSFQEKERSLRKFFGEKEKPFTILMDKYGDTARNFGVIGLPHTIILDRGCGWREQIIGEMEEHEKVLREKVERVLGGEAMRKIIIFFSFILPLMVFAGEREGDLAVLDIKSGEGVRKDVNVDFLTRVLRETAANLTNYRVMTKENVMVILQDKGIDPTKCADVECEVEYGRILQADKLVVGHLEIIEGVYYLSLSLYDAPSASIEKSVSRECEGCAFKKLLEMVRDAGMELFGGVAIPSKPSLREGRVKVVVYDDKGKSLRARIYIDGELRGTSPGTLGLHPGRHSIRAESEGYLKKEEKIYVKEGEEKVVEMRLKAKPTPRRDGKTSGSYFYINGGLFRPVESIGNEFGAEGVIEIGAGLFSFNGFSLSIGARYCGSFERESPQILLIYLEPLYLFLKKPYFSLGGYSDLWLGGGWLNYRDGNGSLAVNDRAFGMDFGVKMRVYYFMLKTGLSFFNFGGNFTPAVIITGGFDLW